MEGAVTTRTDQALRPRALNAMTMCEAFQITASERSDQIALRTIRGGTSITFADYAARVCRLAAGLNALGARPGDSVGLLLTNRPEFHLTDTAAMHLGATPLGRSGT